MKLVFVPPTNRMVLIMDDNREREVSAIEEVWIWIVNDSKYIKVHSSDASHINYLEVHFNHDLMSKYRNRIYLIPDNVYADSVKCNPEVMFPDRINVNRVDICQMFKDRVGFSAYVKETPVGIDIVDFDGNEILVSKSKCFVEEADTGKTYSMSDFNCDFSKWDIHGVSKDCNWCIYINGVTRKEYDDEMSKYIRYTLAGYIFGRKREYSDTECNVAGLLMNTLDLNMNYQVDASDVWIIDRIENVLNGGSPNGTGALYVRNQRRVIISLLSGITSADYFEVMEYKIDTRFDVSIDTSGKASIVCGDGKSLREIADEYYGIKHNDAIDSLLASAAIC